MTKIERAIHYAVDAHAGSKRKGKDKSMHAWYYGSVLELLAEEFGEIPEIREYRELMKAVFG